MRGLGIHLNKDPSHFKDRSICTSNFETEWRQNDLWK